jgi:integrase/recombinase XerD
MTPISTLIQSFLDESDINLRSRSQYKRILDIYYRWLTNQGIDVHHFTKGDIVQYKRYIQTHCKERTVNNYLVVIRKYVNWLRDNNHTEVNMDNLKPVRVRLTFTKLPLTEWEVKKLLNFRERTIKDRRDKFMIRMLLATGFRLSEMLGVKVSDVYTTKKKFYIRITRKGKLHQEAYRIPETTYLSLIKWIDANRLKPDQYVIFNTVYSNRLSLGAATHIIKYRMIRAGINDQFKSAHSLRHTFATMMVKNGMSLMTVSKALGHASIKTTEVYTQQYGHYLVNNAEYINKVETLITSSNYKVFRL